MSTTTTTFAAQLKLQDFLEFAKANQSEAAALAAQAFSLVWETLTTREDATNWASDDVSLVARDAVTSLVAEVKRAGRGVSQNVVEAGTFFAAARFLQDRAA